MAKVTDYMGRIEDLADALGTERADRLRHEASADPEKRQMIYHDLKGEVEFQDDRFILVTSRNEMRVYEIRSVSP